MPNLDEIYETLEGKARVYPLTAKTSVGAGGDDADHSPNRPVSTDSDVLRNINPVARLAESLESIFHRNLVHMRTANAAQPDLLLVRILSGDIVPNGTFGEQEKPGYHRTPHSVCHLGSTSGIIGRNDHLRTALRMG